MLGGVYQTLGGDRRPICADFIGDGLSTRDHIRLDYTRERARQRVNGRCGGRVCDPYTELLDSPSPIGLVIMLWDDNLGSTASRCAVRSPYPAVVDDGGNPFE